MKEISAGITVIIDGNYLLNTSVFALASIKQLDRLNEQLERVVSRIKKKYSTSKVILVSDRRSSWRKREYPEYKAHRKDKRDNSDVDWNYCFSEYESFKERLYDTLKVKVYESENIEGDDWISYILREENKKNSSCLILSSDGDLKQLLNFHFTDQFSYINMLTANLGVDDMYVKEKKFFLPKNHEHYLTLLKEKEDNNNAVFDMFNMSTSSFYYHDIKSVIYGNNIVEVDGSEELFLKLIKGDKGSDNIPNVLSDKSIFGKVRGMGDKSAISIYTQYCEENSFLIEKTNTKEFYDELAYLILEDRKLNYSLKDQLIEKIKLNNTLINLYNIPKDIEERMETIYNNDYVVRQNTRVDEF